MGLDQNLNALPVGTSLKDNFEDFVHRRAIQTEILYWRKNYVLDEWFMANIVKHEEVEWDGPHPISFNKLMELKGICHTVLAALNLIDKVLPRFLVWATDEEEFDKLKDDLIKTEEALSKLSDDPNIVYVYEK